MKVLQRQNNDSNDLYISVCLDDCPLWGDWLKALSQNLPEGIAILKQTEKDLHLVTQTYSKVLQ